MSDEKKPIKRIVKKHEPIKEILPVEKPKIMMIKPNPKTTPIDPLRIKISTTSNVGWDGVAKIFETSKTTPREMFINSQRDKDNFQIDSFRVAYPQTGDEEGQVSTVQVNRGPFDKGFQNVEATIYLKVSQPTPNNYQRLSFMWGRTAFGLAEMMPVYEMVYSSLSHPDPSFHIVFTPDRFLVNKDTKIYFSGDRLVEDKWIGVKLVGLTKNGDQSGGMTWMGIWVDSDPLDTSVNPPEPKNNFKFKCESLYTGFIGADHPPVKTWRSDSEVFRIDGFEKVEVMNVSVREIDVEDFNPFTEEYLQAHRDFRIIKELDYDQIKLFQSHNRTEKI